MAVRSKLECVTVPYIISSNDPENYYYSHLLQYVPYRPEDDFQDRLRPFNRVNAGTGKTFLLKLAKKQRDELYAKGELVVKAYALMCATARLVGGQTLHISLRLPVQKNGRIPPMQKLTGNYLKVMRETMGKI
ncbi:ATP-dependent DNA helicase [Trichonephila clavipes]|nr:ATP-dependent DNA helicase [Trichonephila clavipes]